MRIAATADGVRTARDVVRLVTRDLHERADDAQLLTSELATGAIYRAGDDAQIDVDVRVSDRHVRVELRYPGSTGAPPNQGWSVALVAALSDRWGIVDDASSMAWFELFR